MAGDASCPVCGRRTTGAGSGAVCGDCGWLLQGPLHAGPITPDLRRDFEARLEAARRDRADRDARVLDAALRDVIGDLRPGLTSTVIDIGAEQVTVTTASLDGAGSPQVRHGGSIAWTAILPMLAGAEQARHAQLADGVGGLTDGDIALRLRECVPLTRDGQLLVISRTAGWRIPEAAAAALATGPRTRALRAGGSSGSARGQLAEVAAQAPLRYPYRLMTAAVDGQTGAVTLRPRELFAAGTEPGTEASLILRRMPGDLPDMTLMIFADSGRAGRADGPASDPLALYTVPLPSGPEARLRTVLDGPGRVRIVEPAGAVPHPRTWAQVRAQIPRRVTTAAASIDLICAIDLAGPRDAVRQRVHLVRELVRLLGGEYPDERRLRVGMVTCTDHVFGRRRGQQESEPVTRASELGSAAEALTWLGGTTGAEIGYPPCAPVEDLLDASFRRLGASRRAGRVPRLLTVTGRRPHPYPQGGDNRLPCPRKLAWRHLTMQLRQAGVACAVVADARPGAAERAEWQQLGPAGLRVLPDTTARQVAEDLDLLTPPTQRIPLPLTDEHEGATR